ncbi:DMT family transporter [Roseomonas marmotae]|uniref:DMT family transporter n=1 Tax=Roseomonas marmotae TaxID=2768161 RepID=A0ABS3KFU9_9PROT|nr:DMT family transporter [Roseomonas marmotae]MBO1076348.1 DMT family transporter [Roseomonas marmotae]QTI80580.1 DMT family transporter [Roseomonas marmotae]
MSPIQQAVLLAVAAAFLFNLEASLTKLMVGVPVETILLVRSFGQLVWVAPLLLRTGPDLLRTKQMPMQMLRGLLSLISWGLYYIGFLHLTLATATVLSFTSVLFITALAGPLLKEEVGWRRWAATLVGFAGVLLVVRPGMLPMSWPLAASLLSAFFGAGIALTTRSLARTERTGTIMLYIGIFTTVGALPFAWGGLAWPGWTNALLLAGMGLLGPAGMYLWIGALRLVDASAIAPVTYVRLVFAAATGAVLFQEAIDNWLVAGAALIVGSALYITRQGAAGRVSPPPPHAVPGSSGSAAPDSHPRSACDPSRR